MLSRGGGMLPLTVARTPREILAHFQVAPAPPVVDPVRQVRERAGWFLAPSREGHEPRQVFVAKFGSAAAKSSTEQHCFRGGKDSMFGIPHLRVVTIVDVAVVVHGSHVSAVRPDIEKTVVVNSALLLQQAW